MANILLIDDDVHFTKLLEKLLTKEGHTIFGTCNSAFEGVSLYKFNKKEIDLVLLDINIGVIDGVDILTEIKQIDYYAKVLMVSGEGTSERVNQCIQKGAKGFVVKPINNDSLIKKIRSLV